MTSAEPRIRKSLISGRELFVCDNMVDPMMVKRVAALVRTLHYVRKEKSRPGVPGLAAVSDIPTERIAADPFLCGLRQTVERLFPDEQFADHRAYVNCSIYGDGYYVHRDCAAHEQHVPRFIMRTWNGSPTGAVRPSITTMKRMLNLQLRRV